MTDIITQAKHLAEDVAKEVEAIREHRGGLSIEEFLDQTVLYRDNTATNVIEALAQETWMYSAEYEGHFGWYKAADEYQDQWVTTLEEAKEHVKGVHPDRRTRILRRRVSPSEVME